MKKLLLFLPVLTLWLAACSNDFDVAAPFKEVPVVYAILSATETAQYVRIEKAFLDPQTNALEIAQIADSLYYPADAISVYLERVSNHSQVQLTRVDGNLEGFPRRSGIFATEPNWLYKLESPDGQGLAPAEAYRLIIKRADGKADITAMTTIPGNFTFTKPLPQLMPPIINFIPPMNTEIAWRSDVNGVYFNGTILVHYRNVALNGTLLSSETVAWRAFTNQRRTDNTSGSLFVGKAEINPDNFFKFLHDSIPEVGSNTLRYFDLADIILEGGGKEIDDYQSTLSVATGITSAESIPAYTNISEGFGLFTSKNTTILKGVKIDTKTVDALNDNALTRPLNFRY